MGDLRFSVAKVYGIRYNRYPGTERRKKADVVAVVKDVFENIKESIISNVNKNQDLGPELSDHVLNKVIVYTFKLFSLVSRLLYIHFRFS